MARYCALQPSALDQEKEEHFYYELTAPYLLSVADTWDEIRALQEGVSEEERQKWVRIGCVKNLDELWESRDARPVLPDSLLSPMSRHIHKPAHIERDAMMRVFRNYWYNPKFRALAEEICHRCVVCSQTNVGRKILLL